MLPTSRTKTNNKNNTHFRLLVSYCLGGRVIAHASKIYNEDQQKRNSNRCPKKGSMCLAAKWQAPQYV